MAGDSSFVLPPSSVGARAEPSVSAQRLDAWPRAAAPDSAADALAAGTRAFAEAGPGSWRWLLVSSLLFLLVAGPFLALQAKLLPRWLGQVLNRIYFWPTLPLTLLRSWRDGRGLWCHVDDTLLLGVAPISLLQHPQKLKALGVRGVLNMAEEYRGPEADYRRLGIQQLRLPTVDHFEPSLEDLNKAVCFIEEHRRKGQQVYVHCKAGHGRAAAVALAWLSYAKGMCKEEQLEELNRELLAKRRVRKTLHMQKNLRAFAASTRRARLETSDNHNNQQQQHPTSRPQEVDPLRRRPGERAVSGED